MKKWKHLLKAVMAVGGIAMTAVQNCAGCCFRGYTRIHFN